MPHETSPEGHFLYGEPQGDLAAWESFLPTVHGKGKEKGNVLVSTTPYPACHWGFPGTYGWHLPAPVAPAREDRPQSRGMLCHPSPEAASFERTSRSCRGMDQSKWLRVQGNVRPRESEEACEARPNHRAAPEHQPATVCWTRPFLSETKRNSRLPTRAYALTSFLKFLFWLFFFSGWKSRFSVFKVGITDAVALNFPRAFIFEGKISLDWNYWVTVHVPPIHICYCFTGNLVGSFPLLPSFFLKTSPSFVSLNLVLFYVCKRDPWYSITRDFHFGDYLPVLVIPDWIKYSWFTSSFS